MVPMIPALAGGAGGAKLADGLAAMIGHDLPVVVNTADDFEHLCLLDRRQLAGAGLDFAAAIAKQSAGQ
jgi:2-phospho-L-lactate transferase/gluconeogenesis factor (CofD/UPF0052 family)